MTPKMKTTPTMRMIVKMLPNNEDNPRKPDK